MEIDYALMTSFNPNPSQQVHVERECVDNKNEFKELKEEQEQESTIAADDIQALIDFLKYD